MCLIILYPHVRFQDGSESQMSSLLLHQWWTETLVSTQTGWWIWFLREMWIWEFIYTPVNWHWKITIFNRRCIFKLFFIHSQLSFRGCLSKKETGLVGDATLCLPQQNSRCFIKVVELLLSAAASPTLLDSRGQSPLHMAGPASISKLLLARAQVDQQDAHQMNQGALGFRQVRLGCLLFWP